jgi:hypothetical protein
MVIDSVLVLVPAYEEIAGVELHPALERAVASWPSTGDAFAGLGINEGAADRLRAVVGTIQPHDIGLPVRCMDLEPHQMIGSLDKPPETLLDPMLKSGRAQVAIKRVVHSAPLRA